MTPRKKVNPDLLSPQAVGTYAYMLTQGKVMSAEELNLVMNYGIHSFRTALRELKKFKLIWSNRQQTSSGRWVTVQGFSLPDRWELNEPLYKDPSNGLYTLLVSLYSFYSSKANISNIANTASTSSIANTLLLYALPETSSGKKNKDKNILNIGGKTVSFEFSADDKEYEAEQAKEKERAKGKAKAERREEQEVVHQQRKKNRADKALSKWSALDVAREFASQLHNRWDVAPWELSSSRFVYALNQARERFDSNAELELKMMGLHFAEPVVGRMKDPNAIAMLFVKNYGSLLERAKYQHVSKERWDEYYQKLSEESADDFLN